MGIGEPLESGSIPIPCNSLVIWEIGKYQLLISRLRANQKGEKRNECQSSSQNRASKQVDCPTRSYAGRENASKHGQGCPKERRKAQSPATRMGLFKTTVWQASPVIFPPGIPVGRPEYQASRKGQGKSKAPESYL